MAQIVSLAMVLFTIVPTLAPAMGALLADLFGWRAIMLSFLVFSGISTLWLWLRLNEPLPVDSRRPFRVPLLLSAAREILTHAVVSRAIVVQSVSLGLIFCLIVTVQPIYDVVFGRADSFPYWFGGIALFSATSTSLANAALVVRFGMRRLVTLGMAGQIISASGALIGLTLVPEYAFAIFVVFQFLLIWLSGMCIGNLNAMALEPMGHIAGFTASVTGAVATFIAAAAASLVGYLFNETPFPLIGAALVLSIIGLYVMVQLNARAED